GRPDHPRPLLGVIGDELGEVGGRARKHRTAQAGKLCLELGVGVARVNFLIELVNNLRWCVLGRTDAEPGARLVARHKFAHGRDIGQHLRTRRRGRSWRYWMYWIEAGVPTTMPCPGPPMRSVSAGAPPR